MSLTRFDVLVAINQESNAATESTTTLDVLVDALDSDEHQIRKQVTNLEAIDLVRTYDDGTLRITITGEELIDLGVDDVIIIDTNSDEPPER